MCPHVPIDRIAVLAMYESEGIAFMPVGLVRPYLDFKEHMPIYSRFLVAAAQLALKGAIPSG